MVKTHYEYEYEYFYCLLYKHLVHRVYMQRRPRGVCGVKYLGLSLRWRHDGLDGVSNHDCLLNRLLTGADQRKHQSSASLAFVRGIHRWPVARKMFPFGDVIMILFCFVLFFVFWGGVSKNEYELLNLRAIKISTLYKNCIFQWTGKIFCVEIQRCPLKFHPKYLTHTLKDVYCIRRWIFKSS